MESPEEPLRIKSPCSSCSSLYSSGPSTGSLSVSFVTSASCASLLYTSSAFSSPPWASSSYDDSSFISASKVMSLSQYPPSSLDLLDHRRTSQTKFSDGGKKPLLLSPSTPVNYDSSCNESVMSSRGSLDCPSPCSKTSREVYRQYAEHYSERFRASIDYQYEEKPRQVICAVILLFLLVYLSFDINVKPFSILSTSTEHLRNGSDESSTSSMCPSYAKERASFSSTSCPSSALSHIPSAASASPSSYDSSLSDSSMSYYPSESAGVRRGVMAVLLSLMTYCFLQTRDGLLVRPHPGFWRIVHAIALLHFLFMVALLVQTPEMGRQFIAIIFPEVAESRRWRSAVFDGTLEMDCRLSGQSLLRQLRTPWFPSHVIGWLIKMCIFRDWSFCLVYSFTFELCELSFQWLVPELKECWWDSLILDFLCSNMLGMLLGVGCLRILNSYQYDWVGQRPFYRKALMKFLPFTWSEYNWLFFKSPARLLQAIVLLLMSNLTELNVFFFMYALDIPAGHYIHPLRCMYICALASAAVAEHYEYMNSNGKRIGHNEWLLVTILMIEFLVCLKYGYTRFNRFSPPPGVWVPWVISIGLFGCWCLCHFLLGPHRKLQRENKNKTSPTLKLSGEVGYAKNSFEQSRFSQTTIKRLSNPLESISVSGKTNNLRRSSSSMELSSSDTPMCDMREDNCMGRNCVPSLCHGNLHWSLHPTRNSTERKEGSNDHFFSKDGEGTGFRFKLLKSCEGVSQHHLDDDAEMTGSGTRGAIPIQYSNEGEQFEKCDDTLSHRYVRDCSGDSGDVRDGRSVINADPSPSSSEDPSNLSPSTTCISNHESPRVCKPNIICFSLSLWPSLCDSLILSPFSPLKLWQEKLRENVHEWKLGKMRAFRCISHTRLSLVSVANSLLLFVPSVLCGICRFTYELFDISWNPIGEFLWEFLECLSRIVLFFPPVTAFLPLLYLMKYYHF